MRLWGYGAMGLVTIANGIAIATDVYLTDLNM